MNNGQVTKKILTACKTQTGDALRAKVTSLLNSFPMSSHKLVYDADEQKVSTEAWAILIEQSKATDKTKFESMNRWLVSMGSKPQTESFGRHEA